MVETTRKKIISRILAGIAILLGILIIGLMVVLFIEMLRSFKSIFNSFLYILALYFSCFSIFFFYIPVFVFGCYCIFAGYRLWSQISPINIRRLSFISTAIIFIVFLGFILTPYIEFSKDISQVVAFSQFTACLVMIPAGIFHLFFNRMLLKYFSLPLTIDWTQREKTAKRFFGWFVFFLWSAIFSLMINLSEMENENQSPQKVLLELSGMVASFFLAVVIYKLGVAIALRNKPKETV